MHEITAVRRIMYEVTVVRCHMRAVIAAVVFDQNDCYIMLSTTC